MSILRGLAAPLPLTAKDVSLMLRGGYSNAAVMKELSTRHFVDNVDFAKEEMLVKAGASKELIAALNSGTYALPPEQSAAAQQQIVDLTKKRAVQAEQLLKSNSAYEAQLARQRAAQPTMLMATKHVLYEATKGELVRMQNDRITVADEDALANKKLIALYFSAHWCPPCRKFTPELVDYYNRVITQHPEVEIVLVSSDRSADAMQKYMRETKMPWPAIDFAKIAGKEAISKYKGKGGIPCLVLIDATGRVVSDNYADDVGPQKVLADLDAIFAALAAKHVATTP